MLKVPNLNKFWSPKSEIDSKRVQQIYTDIHTCNPTFKKKMGTDEFLIRAVMRFGVSQGEQEFRNILKRARWPNTTHFDYAHIEDMKAKITSQKLTIKPKKGSDQIWRLEGFKSFGAQAPDYRAFGFTVDTVTGRDCYLIFTEHSKQMFKLISQHMGLWEGVKDEVYPDGDEFYVVTPEDLDDGHDDGHDGDDGDDGYEVMRAESSAGSTNYLIPIEDSDDEEPPIRWNV